MAFRKLFKQGDRVKTVKPDVVSDDWAPGVIEDRKWGVLGTVIRQSDSHGLCYHVEHDDGSVGWYEPRELATSFALMDGPEPEPGEFTGFELDIERT